MLINLALFSQYKYPYGTYLIEDLWMNRIIALWAHPRSLSTVFERMMMQRGDFCVLHEPFSYVYYLYENRRHLPDLEDSDRFRRSYPEARDVCLSEAQHKPLFFKDMAYHALDHLIQDSLFLNQMTHTFIIRDPSRSIPSHFALDPEVTVEEIGCEAQYKLFQTIVATTGVVPVVVDAGDLQNETDRTIQAYCRAVDIPHIPESLRWEKSSPPEWDAWRKWHADAAASETIVNQSNRYERTVANDSRMRSYYEHHLPFYEELRRYRITLSGEAPSPSSR
jgi:hypothetical protein